jgi:hypothetical protein
MRASDSQGISDILFIKGGRLYFWFKWLVGCGLTGIGKEIEQHRVEAIRLLLLHPVARAIE